MKKYEFNVVLSGTGETKETAWEDAVEGFMSDPGATPEDEDIKISDVE